MVSFGISRGFSTKVNEPPVSINSSMSFTFDPITDYKFIMRLWRIAKEFICFLCYRKNVTWPKTNISIPFEDGKTIQIGDLYITGEHQEEELETLEKGRFIKRQYIESCEELILSDLAQNLLYTRHIPDSYNSGRYINASRFNYDYRQLLSGSFIEDIQMEYRKKNQQYNLKCKLKKKFKS